MNLRNIIIGTCSLLLIIVGIDKFLFFLEPPCSLQESIPTMLWRGLGVLQILGGIFIWFKNYRKYIIGFFLGFMIFFTFYHIINDTYDVGGAVFLAILFGVLILNPNFLKRKDA